MNYLDLKLNRTYQFLFFGYFFLLLISFSSSTFAKVMCEKERARLDQIQVRQRQGYSVQRGEYLKEKEDKARTIWWQCKRGKKTSTNKNTVHKSKYKKKSSISNRSFSKIKKSDPFKTNKAIVIKSSYQGEKQIAWLAFYHQLEKCRKPKNLKVFAFCSEHKQQQRLVFEKQLYN